MESKFVPSVATSEYSEPVYLYYGPYEKYGITTNKTDRLKGITALLACENIPFILIPWQMKNLVEIRIHNEVIFRTDITRLHFGGDGQLDPTARAAISAIKEHYKIFVGH